MSTPLGARCSHSPEPLCREKCDDVMVSLLLLLRFSTALARDSITALFASRFCSRAAASVRADPVLEEDASPTGAAWLGEHGEGVVTSQPSCPDTRRTARLLSLYMDILSPSTFFREARSNCSKFSSAGEHITRP